MKTKIPIDVINEMFPDVVVKPSLYIHDFQYNDLSIVSIGDLGRDHKQSIRHMIWSHHHCVIVCSSDNYNQLSEALEFIWGEGAVLFI